MELKFARDMKNNKKAFYRDIHFQEKSQGKHNSSETSPPINGKGGITTMDLEKTGVLSKFFA